MLINPFKINDNKEKDSDASKVELYNKDSNYISYVGGINNKLNFDENQIIKYLSLNFKEYLSNNNRDYLLDKIITYVSFKYAVDKQGVDTIKLNKILDKILGYGILQEYIDDKEITDIRVVKFNLIYVKRCGYWLRVDTSFKSKKELREYIKYCVTKNNQSINYDKPVITFSDKENNLRLEAGISPVNVISDNLVIRIHRNNQNMDLNELLERYKMLDSISYTIMKAIINSKANVIIAGKGGSGKTTILRAMLMQIDEATPITISEETSELCLQNKNVIQREVITSRNKNNFDLEYLLKESLVMSNDILVVGELKGSETAVFVDSITTGHIGYATIHANSIYDSIDRIVMLFKRDEKAKEYSESFIKKILYSSIDYILFMKDFKLQTIGKTIKENDKISVKKIYERED